MSSMVSSSIQRIRTHSHRRSRFAVASALLGLGVLACACKATISDPEKTENREPASPPAVASTKTVQPTPVASRSAAPSSTFDGAWSKLEVMPVVDVMKHGAIGDGVADDLPALKAAVDALPAGGGIVYLPEGKTFLKKDLFYIRRPHVKFWAPNRQAEIFQVVQGQRRRQSTSCTKTEWCGFFGVKLRSDAQQRFRAREDHMLTIDHSTDTEIVGVEIEGSAATGIFLFGSERDYIEGNYIHHTWADHIHHTAGARASWVWDNFIFNEAPSRGDDAVACVTYGPASRKCGDMEWWNNTLLGSAWGRGYAVVGGEDILIHHNWAISAACAGILVASERAWNSASSHDITARNNYVYRAAHTVPHSGILVSGLHRDAEPLSNITFADNVVVETHTGRAYKEEGAHANVVSTGLSEDFSKLPKPIPTIKDVALRDTSTLKTRDVSFVSSAARKGLYRIHVRRRPGHGDYQQRFEYVVQGEASDISDYLKASSAAGLHVSERRAVRGKEYALILSPSPIEVPPRLSAVSFRELRAGDRDGSLTWLWQRLNVGAY